ncbi:MAG: alpha/beta fold hydrolase [Deltaproteobacteria bacterium]|nr:alpha/beta fold hydrolase [Deltaproteobacteria bacterium]
MQTTHALKNLAWGISLALFGLGCGSAITARGPITIADQGFFFVGGRYVAVANNGHIMADQMYVHYQIPYEKKHPYPIVLIHGGGQTANNFESTPDGREGWATFFLRDGFSVYLVDQPGRARSPYQPEVYGPLAPGARASSSVEQRFTAPKEQNRYPQSRLHSQWPGSGKRGDPAFDQFFASQVSGITNGGVSEKLNQAAVAALLDKIGSAIILTHSMSGTSGWLIADARPGLVKGVVGIEPSSPPFRNLDLIGPPEWFRYSAALDKPYGITRLPIAYDPPIKDPAELKPLLEAKADRADVTRCYLQSAPPRKLVNLLNVPVLIVSGEASFHSPWDHCTGKYLTRAGVANQYVRLEDYGIRGTGHMMMLEKNSLEIAKLIADWLERHVDRTLPLK